MAKSSSGLTGAQKPPTFGNKGTSGAMPKGKTVIGRQPSPFQGQRKGTTEKLLGIAKYAKGVK